MAQRTGGSVPATKRAFLYCTYVCVSGRGRKVLSFQVERSEGVFDVRLMQLQPDDELELNAMRSQLNDVDAKNEMAKESPMAKPYWVKLTSLKIIDAVLTEIISTI